VFRELDGDKKRRAVIMQRKLQNVDSKSFESMEDIDRIGDELKGMFKKVYVICFPHEQQEIEQIFEKYSIKNKPYSNEAVEYFYIDQVSTINPHSNIYNNSPSKINNIELTVSNSGSKNNLDKSSHSTNTHKMLSPNYMSNMPIID